jgi:hypothetical protein
MGREVIPAFRIRPATVALPRPAVAVALGASLSTRVTAPATPGAAVPAKPAPRQREAVRSTKPAPGDPRAPRHSELFDDDAIPF